MAKVGTYYTVARDDFNNTKLSHILEIISRDLRPVPLELYAAAVGILDDDADTYI
jgi:hypothetical protein